MGYERGQRRFLLPSGEDLRQLREEVGLTQAKLAKLASKHGEMFSQPLIARIETGTVNPPLSKVRILLDVLYAYAGEGEQLTAGAIATVPVVTTGAETRIREVIETLEAKGISQVPVINSQGVPVGSLTEKHLAEVITLSGEMALEMAVGQIMEESFPEVDVSTPIAVVEELLAQNPTVIVREGQAIAGILTRTNLLQYYRKVGMK